MIQRTEPKIKITAPSRLHFGMFSMGHTGVRQFGGVGMMIENPRTVLTLGKAASIESTGPCSERANYLAKRWFDHHVDHFLDGNGCKIEIESVPEEHVGLGVGTQLGISIAAGLTRLYQTIDKNEDLNPEQLAISVGRGARSSIGSYGFLQGGFLVEGGKLHAQELGPLIAKTSVCEDWRFLLVIPKRVQGISGTKEKEAFQKLDPFPREYTEKMCHEVLMKMLPALHDHHFDDFSRSLRRFGELAGKCFAPVQGEIFAYERAAELIEMLDQNGISGIAQSSWGPTLCAVVKDQQSAESIQKTLIESNQWNDCNLMITKAANSGATIESI